MEDHTPRMKSFALPMMVKTALQTATTAALYMVHAVDRNDTVACHIGFTHVTKSLTLPVT